MKETTQFWSKNRSSLLKEQREATRRVHSTIWIKIQQIPLNLTCYKGNTTECRPRVTGLWQLNNVSWRFAVKPGTQQLSLPRRIRNKSTTRRTKGRNIRLRTKHSCLSYFCFLGSWKAQERFYLYIIYLKIFLEIDLIILYVYGNELYDESFYAN